MRMYFQEPRPDDGDEYGGLTPRKATDTTDWAWCERCLGQIPVVRDLVLDHEHVGSQALRRTGTFTYVCPLCGHVHVGTPQDWGDVLRQERCFACRTPLGNAWQCPRCQYPRGWVKSQCYVCESMQPVFAPHLVASCDVYTLDCVVCGNRYVSYCIC